VNEQAIGIKGFDLRRLASAEGLEPGGRVLGSGRVVAVTIAGMTSFSPA
jgi:hypothetical protein